MNFLQDIEKLADLKERGILTEAEFVQKKAEMLARDMAEGQGGAEDYEPPVRREVANVADRLLIEQRVSNEMPSQAMAYVLWFFTAVLGGHRFYLGKTSTAILMLVCSCTIVGLAVSIPWAFIDLFLIPGMLREKIDAIRDRLTLRSI
jgi:TM2 domain-containing membrane protein YozV